MQVNSGRWQITPGKVEWLKSMAQAFKKDFIHLFDTQRARKHKWGEWQREKEKQAPR